MGQLVDFYAGSPEAVGRALSDHDYEALRDAARFPLHVDFSLHLSPVDFDLMTEEAQRLVGSGPTSLLDSFERRVGGDGEECSADVASAAWVQMMSSVPDAAVESLILGWARALVAEYDDPGIVASDEMRQALRELIGLCREATQRVLPVVHTWSL